MAKRLTIPDKDISVFARLLDDGLNVPMYGNEAKLSDEFAKYLTDWVEEHRDEA